MKEKFDGLVEHLLAGNMFLEEAIEILEKAMIERALERTHGNQSEASKMLGIHRNTLQRKVGTYGIGNGRVRLRRKPVGTQGSRRRRSSVA